MRELPQEVRDEVGTLLLRITLRELFTWRFMQVGVMAFWPLRPFMPPQATLCACGATSPAYHPADGSVLHNAQI